MSRSTSNKRQPGAQGPRPAPRPAGPGRSIRNFSLLMLVLVDFIIALTMVVSFFRFVFAPDPSLEAGPMYVTLTLTTAAAMLMFFLALNASFLPFVSRQHARDARLVMWAMGATGIVTGVLTLGEAVETIVWRLFLGSVAFVFIRIQEARLERAHTSAAPGQAGPPVPEARPNPRSRQRRGGRKR